VPSSVQVQGHSMTAVPSLEPQQVLAGLKIGICGDMRPVPRPESTLACPETGKHGVADSPFQCAQGLFRGLSSASFLS
jgi:hypothetical protein